MTTEDQIPQDEQNEQTPAPKMLHEKVIEQIQASADLSDEVKEKAIKEINLLLEANKCNVMPAGNYSVNHLFEYTNSVNGVDFWAAIQNALSK